MRNSMPSFEEQDFVKNYVLKRPVLRPDADLKKAIRCIVLFFLFSILLSACSYFVFQKLGVFSYLPQILISAKEESEAFFMFLYYAFIVILSGIFLLKPAAIGCIKLYQHYAPEHVRRKCLLMPTCSEYAILSIKKYGVIIGAAKTIHRLFFRCRGNVYYIDYP